MKNLIVSKINYSFITPFFMIDHKTYAILDFLIIITVIISLSSYHYYDKKRYLIITTNVILEILYNIFFLLIQNLFLMFSIKLFQFIFSIHLNSVIYDNKKSAKYSTPYILWNFILTLLNTLILFLNV